MHTIATKVLFHCGRIGPCYLKRNVASYVFRPIYKHKRVSIFDSFYTTDSIRSFSKRLKRTAPPILDLEIKKLQHTKKLANNKKTNAEIANVLIKQEQTSVLTSTYK